MLPAILEANKFPCWTETRDSLPRMLEGHRRLVPLFMGTKVEQTVAHIVKKFPSFAFKIAARANLRCRNMTT